MRHADTTGAPATGGMAALGLTTLVLAEVDALASDLLALRRDIHAHPEPSWQERRTTAVVAEVLRQAGARITLLDPTGLWADIGAEAPTRRVALRGDLDALPVVERTGLPWASTREGVAHACGHDVHTVGVLGAGLALLRHEQALRDAGVAVRLLLQPAEETMPGGALRMLDQGALEGVDELFALHCDPTVDVGQVGLVDGPITAASDEVVVTLGGRGGHTSRPHLTNDLACALGDVVVRVPAILSRRLDPRGANLLVWGQVQAGTAGNVVPSHGEARGTLRILDVETWQAAEGLVEEVVRQVAAPYGVSVEVRHERGVPPVQNDRLANAHLRAGVAAALGADAAVPTRQSMGGEDLGWLTCTVPGAMGRLGTRTPGGPTHELHQGDLVVDEAALPIASKVLACAGLAALGLG